MLGTLSSGYSLTQARGDSPIRRFLIQRSANFALLLASVCVIFGVSPVYAAPIAFVNDEAGWLVELGTTPVESFSFSSTNVALSDEVFAPPSSGTLFNVPALNFNAANTGLSNSIAFTNHAPIFSDGIVFVDVPPSGLATSTPTSADHDWSLDIIGGTPVFAIGVTVSDGVNPIHPETFSAFGEGGALIVDVTNVSTNLGENFFGVISDVPITSVFYSDDPATGGRGIFEVQLAGAPIPVPPAMLLFFRAPGAAQPFS